MPGTGFDPFGALSQGRLSNATTLLTLYLFDSFFVLKEARAVGFEPSEFELWRGYCVINSWARHRYSQSTLSTPETGNPGKQRLLKTPLLSHQEVPESDRRIWQQQFFSGVKKLLGQFMYDQNASRDNLPSLKAFKVDRIRHKDPKQSIKVSSYNGLFQFLEPASCEPISPEMVLYNRIFKTGSETLGTLFQFVATLMDYDYAKSKSLQL